MGKLAIGPICCGCRRGTDPKRRTPDVEGERGPRETTHLVVSVSTGLCSSRSNAEDFYVSEIINDNPIFF